MSAAYDCSILGHTDLLQGQIQNFWKGGLYISRRVCVWGGGGGGGFASTILSHFLRYPMNMK